MKYITDSYFNRLKRPFAKPETDRLLLLACDGDSSSRDLLIEHNLRLVLKIATRLAKNREEVEEYYSEGIYGLVKAIDSFKKDKVGKISLSTYASICIQNEILMFMRKHKRKSEIVSINDDIDLHSPSDKNITLISCLVNKEIDNNEALDKEHLYIELHEALRTLDEREIEIIKKYYGLGSIEDLKLQDIFNDNYGTNEKQYTELEISQSMGVSRSYISRLKGEALKKLGAYLNTPNKKL